MIANLHSIAEVVALRFVDSLAVGTLICALAGIILRLAPRQNAATRFGVWFSALVAIAASPWIARVLPHASHAVTPAHQAAITLPDSWAVYLLALWSAVTAWFGFGVVRALRHLHVLRRGSVTVDMGKLDTSLRETLGRHGGNRRIVLCTSEQVRVPTAVGLFKPMILVPGWVLRELTPDDLNQILLHELAHFRRWDDWTNLAQQVVKAIFFFHPAVWWIDKKVAFEREIACDDAVLAETRRPRAYAECLAHLAEKSFVNRSIALAQAALGKVRQTSARIVEILDVNRPSPASRRLFPAVSLVAVLAVVCGAFYSRTPKLVAFASSAQAHQAESADVSAHMAIGASDIPMVAMTPAKFSVSAMPAKLKAKKALRKTESLDQPQVLPAKLHERHDDNLVHLTSSTSVAPRVTETFLVVVESEVANPVAPPAYQIQMWRVTVFRTVISAPNHQIPRSET